MPLWLLNTVCYVAGPVGVALFVGYLLVYVLEWA